MTPEDIHRRFALFNEFKHNLEIEGIVVKTHTFEDFEILGNCSGIYKLKYSYDQDDQHHEKSVLMKIPSSGLLYHYMKNLNIYENEAIMYNAILPEMYKYWNGPIFSAESYHRPDSYYDLIMEDLTTSGYRVPNKMEQLDLPQSIAVLRTLAKFHAISVKLYETSPQIMGMLKNDYMAQIMEMSRNDCNDGPGTLIRDYIETLYDRFLRTVEELSLPENVIRKLQNFRIEHFWNEAYRTVAPEDSYQVLCHSDLWTTNFMFKYNHQHEVEGIKFIDFQAVRKSCPAVDLIQFFVYSVKFEVYEQNRELLLETYSATMNRTLRDLRCRAFYSEDDLKADLEKFKLTHVNLLSAGLPMVLREEGNSANHEKEKLLPFTSQVYRNALRKWLDYLIREDIL